MSTVLFNSLFSSLIQLSKIFVFFLFSFIFIYFLLYNKLKLMLNDVKCFTDCFHHLFLVFIYLQKGKGSNIFVIWGGGIKKCNARVICNFCWMYPDVPVNHMSILLICINAIEVPQHFILVRNLQSFSGHNLKCLSEIRLINHELKWLNGVVFQFFGT